jgi:hypothetical protein
MKALERRLNYINSQKATKTIHVYFDGSGQIVFSDSACTVDPH